MTNQFNEQGTFKWISLAKTEAPVVAQRDLHSGWKDVIRDEFKLGYLGVPVVNHDTTADKYWILDGQHRIGALKDLDYTKVFAEVFQDLTPSEEVELFRGRQSKPTSAYQKFKLSLKNGEPFAIHINRILKDRNVSLGESKGPDRTSAVSGLRKAFFTVGPDGLEDVVELLYARYGAAGLTNRLIEGCSNLLAANRQMEMSALSARLETISLNDLNTRIDLDKRVSGKDSISVVDTLKDIANRGLGKGNRGMNLR